MFLFPYKMCLWHSLMDVQFRELKELVRGLWKIMFFKTFYFFYIEPKCVTFNDNVTFSPLYDLVHLVLNLCLVFYQVFVLAARFAAPSTFCILLRKCLSFSAVVFFSGPAFCRSGTDVIPCDKVRRVTGDVRCM